MAGRRKASGPLSLRKLPRAVRNLVALHSLTIESRYNIFPRNRLEKGRYDVLQREQVLDTYNVTTYRVVAVIDIKDSEAGMVQDILNGLEE